jgi:hypothetical protein
MIDGSGLTRAFTAFFQLTQASLLFCQAVRDVG